MSRFSNRLPPHAERNAISRAIDALGPGASLADLTASNPTAAGIGYPADLLAGLAAAESLRYQPQPFGLPSARAVIAEDWARRGAHVDPAHIALSASTSESYAWLFKLFCDPGDAVLVPQPSYPLFEHLTRLEGVCARPYRLEYHGRWEIDPERMRGAPDDVRALLVVSPNNPTGSYISTRELAAITEVCRARGWTLIVDEVFADYALEQPAPLTDLAARAGVLTFSLGGASKSLGLPQIKLGWIVAGGPPAERDAALASLELVADTYLSVATPVQTAAPELFRLGAVVRSAIHARVRDNLERARDIAGRFPACSLLRAEGGWSAVVRIPATHGEEAFVLDLLRTERVLVHPGYFFDFTHEAFIVVSLLPETDVFADAFERALRLASRAT